MIRALPLLLLWAGAAFAQASPEAVAAYGSKDAARSMIIRSSTDVAALSPALQAFSVTRPDIRITYEQWGSNDLYLRGEAACKGEVAASDLVITSSVDQQVKLVNDGCAQPYVSALTARLPAAARWRDEIFGVTREPVVMVYNRDLVDAADAPRSRFDLIDLLRPEGSRFAGRIATYDIEASGLGYLLAFQDSQTATTFGSLIEAFGRSGAVATCCSAEIIDGVAEGRYLIAYNVLGSYAQARAAHDRRIAIVAPQDYTLVLSRAAMIPRQAENPGDAGAFIDFLLSDAGIAALTQTRMMLPSGGTDDMGLGPDDAASLRPVTLSPTLLLGLDRAKRAGFLEIWRGTFPKH